MKYRNKGQGEIKAAQETVSHAWNKNPGLLGMESLSVETTEKTRLPSGKFAYLPCSNVNFNRYIQGGRHKGCLKTPPWTD